jgi:hypothetical protein
VSGCTKTHHCLLHNDNAAGNPNSSLDIQAQPFLPAPTYDNGRSATHTASTSADYIAMHTIPVILAGRRGEVLVNALLDEGSTDSYLSESVAAQLGLDGPQVSRMVSVLGGEIPHQFRVSGFQLTFDGLTTEDT